MPDLPDPWGPGRTGLRRCSAHSEKNHCPNGRPVPYRRVVAPSSEFPSASQGQHLGCRRTGPGGSHFFCVCRAPIGVQVEVLRVTETCGAKTLPLSGSVTLAPLHNAAFRSIWTSTQIANHQWAHGPDFRIRPYGRARAGINHLAGVQLIARVSRSMRMNR